MRFRDWSNKRQLLGRQGRDAVAVLHSVVGVYSSHPSAPLSLYARTASLEPRAFIDLDKDQRAFRVPAMRLTVYMVPAETAHKIFSATVPEPTDPVWEKRYSQKGRRIPPEHYHNWTEKVLQAAQIPRTAAEIQSTTGIPQPQVKPMLNRMAFEGSLLRVGADNLRSNIIRYADSMSWAGDRFTRIPAGEALAWLAREYWRAFGPARIEDFRWWAGIPAGKAKAAAATLKTTSVDGDYLLLDDDMAEFERFRPSAEDTVDILPQWDPYLMGYAPDGRERFVDHQSQQHVYGSLGATDGNALAAVLINGKVHGVWKSRFQGSKMIIRLFMFEKPPGKLADRIHDGFQRVAHFLQAGTMEIQRDSAP